MGGLDLPFFVIAALTAVSFVAGWIDSIVGGGGLIQLPSLLIGLPANTAVPTIAGTNKVPSSMGTAMASYTYARRVKVDWWGLVPLVTGAALGSVAGAQLTHFMDRKAFNPLVLAAIVAVGWYTYRRPELGLQAETRHTGWAAHARLGGIGLAVGAWDGFIGPGTGTFFLILLVGVMGFEFLTATTLAKLANLTTNVAAISTFAVSGHVLWGLALTMGVANVTGSVIGSRMALRNGNAFVRKVFLAMIVVLGAKLAWDTVAMFL